MIELDTLKCKDVVALWRLCTDGANQDALIEKHFGLCRCCGMAEDGTLIVSSHGRKKWRPERKRQ